MQKLITVIGATALGKSDFAVKLAKKFNGEIVSADSRQIYKKLNLTTGKITASEMQGIKHHMLDLIEPAKPYSVFDFVTDAKPVVEKICESGKLPIICGGTGLYTRALVEGFGLTEREKADEKQAAQLSRLTVDELQQIVAENKIVLVETDVKNKRRLINAILKHKQNVKNVPNNRQYKVLQICLTCEREALRERIKVRLQKRIAAGMLDEVKKLINDGYNKDFLKTLGLDIKYAIMYLDGEFKTFDEYFERAWISDCQYSKRQTTWFKKERDCIYLDIFDTECFEKACKEVEKFLKEK